MRESEFPLLAGKAIGEVLLLGALFGSWYLANIAFNM